MSVEVTSASGILYEPFAVGIPARSISLYERLRDEAPIYRTDSGYWAVSRYADVKEVLRHPERFSSKGNESAGLGLDLNLEAADPSVVENLMKVAAQMPVALGDLFSAEALVATDPPHHTRLRKIVNRGFVPRRIAELDQQIHATVDSCLAGIETADEFEVVSRLAIPLPVQTIADLLSVDSADYHRVKSWSVQFSDIQGPPLRGTPEGLAVFLDMFKSFSEYFVPRIDAHKANAKDDLISDLVRATESDILTTTEALLFIFQLMAAGNETTTSAITNMVVALKQNPEQYDLLMHRPDLLPNAIEEIIRYRPPLQLVFRTVLVESQLSGVTIPAGDTIAVLIGSANLDPRQFSDPDRFDITRDTSSMIGFGFGIHNCIGAHLARSEIRTAMTKLLPHLARFELADEPLTYRASYMMYNLDRVRLLACQPAAGFAHVRT